MLRELRVRNVAVIESAAVTFGPGLNVLTGETGAGKSILVDAILLVVGARAQTEAIRTGADTATVEAVFDLEPDSSVAALLAEAGLTLEDRYAVIRRELTRTGRHRAFVNDSPVTIGLLQRLGGRLVEVHGQHEFQRLLEPARQLDLLDRFANSEELRRQVAESHARHQAARAAVEALSSAERDRAQREDLLRFQISELDAARLRPGEEDALRGERRRLQHTERLEAGLAEVWALLEDDRESVTSRLHRAARILGDLGRLDAAFLASLPTLETALVQVEELLATLRGLREGLTSEPGRLEAIDDRLDALTRLKRKYGDDEKAMLDFRESAAHELEQFARHEESLAVETRRLRELSGELARAAADLTAARSAGAARLGPRVAEELRLLGMAQARFEVHVETHPTAEISARGLERVEFRFSANPGEDLRPLARIASGGELARTMLGLQVVLAKFEEVATMVFDEVDAGIGGRTATAVADKLAAVAGGRQVLCVTHLAAIAARADGHVRVAKAVRAGRARVHLEALEGEDRIEEVARMLGGDRVTETARAHARELLRVGAGRRRGS